MASWVLKAIAQRVIGALPYRELWNEFFQEWVTHSLRLDEQTFEEHLRKDAQHLDYLRKHMLSLQKNNYKLSTYYKSKNKFAYKSINYAEKR